MSCKIALVTGGNDGIGFEVVKYLALKGHKVIVGSRSTDKGAAAAEKINQEAKPAHPVTWVQLNITDLNSVTQAVKKVEQDHGKLDILVNNAGVGHMDKIPQQRASTVDSTILRDAFETNFFGLVQNTNAFIPLMQKAELPVIVNVSTDMASIHNQALPNSGLHVTAYNTSKSAANAYTVALAHDLTNFKINSVTPGYTATKLNAFSGPKSTADAAALISKYALIDKDGPTSKFFDDKGERAW